MKQINFWIGKNNKEQTSLTFALLVGYCARGFACALAWSLALATTALFGRFFQICLIDSFDVFHWVSLPWFICMLCIRWLGYCDSNTGNVGVRVRCLTAWRYPNIFKKRVTGWWALPTTRYRSLHNISVTRGARTAMLCTTNIISQKILKSYTFIFKMKKIVKLFFLFRSCDRILSD